MKGGRELSHKKHPCFLWISHRINYRPKTGRCRGGVYN
jgi:hypothetical protein